jgi:hypothetical protein
VVTVEEAIAEGRRAVAIAEGRKAVAIVGADLAARRREEAIVAVLPEVVQVVRPAVEEARHHQAAVLPQGTTDNSSWRRLEAGIPSPFTVRRLRKEPPALLDGERKGRKLFHGRNNLIRQWRFGDKEEPRSLRSSKIE